MKIKFLIMVSFLTLSQGLLAEENSKPYEAFQGCGEYFAAGTVHSTKAGYFLVINEKTRSEYTFKSPIPEEPKFAPYVDKPLLARITINKKIDGTRGDLEKVLKVEHRIPNPLHPILDTGFRLIKRMECKK